MSDASANYERWTTEDQEQLRRDWSDPDVDREELPTRYNRTMASIAQKAIYMRLGSRPADSHKARARQMSPEQQAAQEAVERVAAERQAETLRDYYARQGRTVQVEIVRISMRGESPSWSPRLVTPMHVPKLPKLTPSPRVARPTGINPGWLA